MGCLVAVPLADLSSPTRAISQELSGPHAKTLLNATITRLELMIPKFKPPEGFQSENKESLFGYELL
jgi:hypothetical protein